MLRCRLASAPLVAGLLVVSCTFATAAEPRAFLELFTSQGCSSCPPADKLLGELAADPSLIAVSVPIDYWDYLGWKDTLASPGHSARQRAYARLRGDREVYTPQIVVNGSAHALGSDRAAVEHAIMLTDRNTAIMSVPVQLSVVGSNLNVKVAAGREHVTGEVWLCPLASTVKVDIDRGENRGRTVIYHNVVRRWTKLGDYNGAEATWNIPVSDVLTDEIDAAAVMVQQGVHERPGVVLGAALVPMRRQTTEVKTPR